MDFLLGIVVGASMALVTVGLEFGLYSRLTALIPSTRPGLYVYCFVIASTLYVASLLNTRAFIGSLIGLLFVVVPAHLVIIGDTRTYRDSPQIWTRESR